MAALEWFYLIPPIFSLSQWVKLKSTHWWNQNFFSRNLIFLYCTCTNSFRANFRSEQKNLVRNELVHMQSAARPPPPIFGRKLQKSVQNSLKIVEKVGPISQSRDMWPLISILHSLLPQRASLKRTSKAADPNLCMWVKISILPLHTCSALVFLKKNLDFFVDFFIIVLIFVNT